MEQRAENSVFGHAVGQEPEMLGGFGGVKVRVGVCAYTWRERISGCGQGKDGERGSVETWKRGDVAFVCNVVGCCGWVALEVGCNAGERGKKNRQAKMCRNHTLPRLVTGSAMSNALPLDDTVALLKREKKKR